MPARAPKCVASTRSDLKMSEGRLTNSQPHGCPFCGASTQGTVQMEDIEGVGSLVRCPACKAEGPIARGKNENKRNLTAIKLWNKRIK